MNKRECWPGLPTEIAIIKDEAGIRLMFARGDARRMLAEIPDGTILKIVLRQVDLEESPGDKIEAPGVRRRGSGTCRIYEFEKPLEWGAMLPGEGSDD